MTELTPVRLAVPDDEPEIKRLCRLLHDENGFLPLSERKLDALMQRYYDKAGAIIGVIGDVGNPVASIYLSVDPIYYSDSFILNEAWNFVSPEHRRSNYAISLISYAKRASDELRLPLIIGILSNQRVEAKVKLYERVLDKAGAYFIHNRQFAGVGG